MKISSPAHLSRASIRLFALSRLAWIRKHQQRILALDKPESWQYLSGEHHYFQGRKYRLQVIYINAPPSIRITEPATIELCVRPRSSLRKRQSVLHAWYRQQLKEIIAGLLVKWLPLTGVKPDDWRIRQMRTRWGTCNRTRKRIWLNLELVKKPLPCIEYVLVHELVHLLERNHSKRFKALMDKFLPRWKILKAELNAVRPDRDDE